jgi:hypothetical protein
MATECGEKQAGRRAEPVSVSVFKSLKIQALPENMQDFGSGSGDFHSPFEMRISAIG